MSRISTLGISTVILAEIADAPGFPEAIVSPVLARKSPNSDDMRALRRQLASERLLHPGRTFRLLAEIDA